MITYYRSSEDTRKIEEVAAVKESDWVRSERPGANDLDALHALGIDAGILTDALDPHEVPRIEHDDGWTYFITRVPDVGDDFNDYTTPIMFALGKNQMATISRDLLGRLWQPFIDTTTIPTARQSQLFLSMIEMLMQSYQTRVAAINRQMRAATSDISVLSPRDIATFVEYERKLNDYLDALIPTNVALEKTLNPRTKLIRLGEDRDSYRAVMDTRLNETMRILTVATLALTIPTMLAGLFGMNVDFPFNTHGTLAFWIVVGTSIVAAVGVNYYFLRKR